MFRSIVVGTDGSATATEAVHRAHELAGALSADLHVVSAYRPPAAVLAASAEPALTPAAVVQWTAAARDDVRRLLDEVAAALAGPVPVTTHAVAETVHADLIVVGNRGMQGARRVLGSIPNHVSHHASCDVLVVDTVHVMA